MFDSYYRTDNVIIDKWRFGENDNVFLRSLCYCYRTFRLLTILTSCAGTTCHVDNVSVSKL